MRHRRWLETASILALFGGGCVELKIDIHIPTDATSADVRDGTARDASATDADTRGQPCGAAFCTDNRVCAGDRCVAPRFRSTGAEGAFAPTTDVALSPGAHHYTTIRIPVGVTVSSQPGGNGTLELLATGDVLIEGTVDVSGGSGGNGVTLDCVPSVQTLGGGNGGETGSPRAGDAGVAGVGGAGGRGGAGQAASPGNTHGGDRGGGAGGDYCGTASTASGGGGGGFAGGGGGGGIGLTTLGIRSVAGGEGAATEGTAAMSNRGGGGDLGVYAGAAGLSFAMRGCIGQDAVPLGTPCEGGGGGSIGARAARDLAVTTTFQPGSGGGGGGSLCLFASSSPSCPASMGYTPSTGGGGGGGGGALRIASATRVTVRGSLRARGGDGGLGVPGRSGGGGGGSGGVIDLYAPLLDITGNLDASGGPGGQSSRTMGMLRCEAHGGNGGPGRIRISTQTARCSLTGTLTPQSPSGCAASPDGGVAGNSFVTEYPN